MIHLVQIVLALIIVLGFAAIVYGVAWFILLLMGENPDVS